MSQTPRNFHQNDALNSPLSIAEVGFKSTGLHSLCKHRFHGPDGMLSLIHGCLSRGLYRRSLTDPSWEETGNLVNHWAQEEQLFLCLSACLNTKPTWRGRSEEDGPEALGFPCPIDPFCVLQRGDGAWGLRGDTASECSRCTQSVPGPRS